MKPLRVSKHVLYEASVQDTEVDLHLIDRMVARSTGGVAKTLREDFCGTAVLACAWVQSDPERESWGVDLHAPILKWAKKHRLAELGKDATRVRLLEENVLTVQTPSVDVIAALNFSYMIFEQRELLKQYFQNVFDHLTPGGVFVLDLFGGPNAQAVMKEKKKVPEGTDFAGVPYPDFTYEWDQADFNAVNQHITCHIHFKGKTIVPILNAFTYDWRLWSITEIIDVLKEVGFISVDPYFEGWCDESGTTDGQLKIRKSYKDMLAWICYLGATKAV